MSFGTLLSNTVNNWTQLELGMGAVSRMETFCETVTNESQGDTTEMPSKDWPRYGEIKMEDVSASYEYMKLLRNTFSDQPYPPITGDQVLAVKELNFTIEAGEKIAVVGRTGRLVLALQSNDISSVLTLEKWKIVDCAPSTPA